VDLRVRAADWAVNPQNGHRRFVLVSKEHPQFDYAFDVDDPMAVLTANGSFQYIDGVVDYIPDAVEGNVVSAMAARGFRVAIPPKRGRR
jgi:hypothetical protein